MFFISENHLEPVYTPTNCLISINNYYNNRTGGNFKSVKFKVPTEPPLWRCLKSNPSEKETRRTKWFCEHFGPIFLLGFSNVLNHPN